MDTSITSSQDLISQAFTLKKDIEKNFIRMAQLLYEIHRTGAWQEQYESFDNPTKYNFVEELGISKPTANKLINIYKLFGLKHQIPEDRMASLGWSKLSEILPDAEKADDQSKVEDLVLVAECAPTQQELRRTLDIRRGGKIENCAHADYYTLNICRDCGDKWSVIDADRVSRIAALTNTRPPTID